MSLSGQNKLSTDRVNGGDITLVNELQFHLYYIFILKNKTFLRKVALNLSLTARVERTKEQIICRECITFFPPSYKEDKGPMRGSSKTPFVLIFKFI